MKNQCLDKIYSRLISWPMVLLVESTPKKNHLQAWLSFV